MQNSAVHMTKEQYFEMCDVLGTTPQDDQVPVEFDDFPDEIQIALSIYRLLRDEWEFMAGNYLGKNLNGIFEIFEAYNINALDKRFYLELLHVIDGVRIEQIQQQKQQQQPAK